MAEPFVPALREMANPTWGIVSQQIIEKYGGGGLAQNGWGAGPFMLEEFRGNERVVLRRNPNYFIEGRPYLDGMTIVVITENSSLISAFEQGQHDVCGAILDKEDFDDFSENADYSVARAPSLFYPVVHMKVIRPPFDQIRVRQAIDMSINRQQLIDVIWKGEGNYNGPIQWPQIKWSLPQDELRDFQVYDPEGAKTLLAEAGFPNGFSTTMKLPSITGVSFIADMATVLAAQWAEVGIDVQLDEVELGSYIGSTLLTGNFDMTFFPNLPYDEPDRPLSFYHTLGVTGSGNWTNYTNPELDALIDAQAATYDEADRQQIITDAQHLILDEYGPQLTLPGGFQYSARWNYVHFPWDIDGEPPLDSNPLFVDIWTEKV
jgi:peptide/nickel transport system substrate-binding protein